MFGILSVLVKEWPVTCDLPKKPPVWQLARLSFSAFYETCKTCLKFQRFYNGYLSLQIVYHNIPPRPIVGRRTNNLVIVCIFYDAIAWRFHEMCVSIYIRRYLRLGLHEFMFRDYNFAIVFSLEIRWETSAVLSNLFPLWRSKDLCPYTIGSFLTLM